MGSRLERIEDWALLAKRARYNVGNLAQLCAVSPRQLRRFFDARKSQSPHEWMHHLRMRRAVELICDGTSMKETGLELGYKDLAHFCNDFLKYYDVSPSKFLLTKTDLRQPHRFVRF